MYDQAHPRYLNDSQQEKLKPLKQNFRDINPTCKHAFLDAEYLSIFPLP